MNTSVIILLYGGYENMGYIKRNVVIVLIPRGGSGSITRQGRPDFTSISSAMSSPAPHPSALSSPPNLSLSLIIDTDCSTQRHSFLHAEPPSSSSLEQQHDESIWNMTMFALGVALLVDHRPYPFAIEKGERGERNRGMSRETGSPMMPRIAAAHLTYPPMLLLFHGGGDTHPRATLIRLRICRPRARLRPSPVLPLDRCLGEPSPSTAPPPTPAPLP